MTWKPLSGVVPPLVTPLTDRDTIDREGTERLLEHVIAGGVSGVFVLGSTGEGPSLSYRLRRDFIRMTCELVGRRVPVLVGVTDTAFVESIALAEVANEAGAAAAVLTTPYYFPAGQTELTRYIDHVVEEIPLPLMLYNMPGLTKVWLEIETLRGLARHPQIVGVKDSSGDLDYFGRLAALKEVRPDWTIMIGPEHLTPQAVALGGDGGVNGAANFYPELFVSLYQAAAAGDQDQIAKIMTRVDALQAIYEVGKYGSRFIKATKCACSLLGICSDKLAEPFKPFLAAGARASETDIGRLARRWLIVSADQSQSPHPIHKTTMNANVFRGCIPALMTPCHADRTPNFDALVRKGKQLMDAGMSGVVYCGSMGDWPLLSDGQRQQGVQQLVDAGVPVIVGTGAQNPKLAADHAAHAAEVGAAGLMAIPRVLSSRHVAGCAAKPFCRDLFCRTEFACRDLQQPLLRVRDQGGSVF